MKNFKNYADYGGSSLNLQQFWKNVNKEKMTYEQAALNTFTGKWAKKNGFERVVFDPDREILETEVIVKFIKE